MAENQFDDFSDSTPRNVNSSGYEKQYLLQESYFQKSYGGNMLPGETNYIRRQVDALLKFAQLDPEQETLEIGCGMGRYTFELLRRNYQLEGLDLTQYLLDEFERLNPGFTIPLHCANALDPPQELLDRFDAVIGFFTLHHLPDLEASFRASARMCKPGGIIAFLEPNPLNPLYYFQIPFTRGMSFKGEKGMFQMRRKPLFEAARKAGLSRPRLMTFGSVPPFLMNRTWGPKLEDGLSKFIPQSLQCFIVFVAEVDGQSNSSELSKDTHQIND
jgi:SAM-dependent methyltransferase